MKILQVYPTSRALRTKSTEFRKSDALLPTLMRMDEFESRALLLRDVVLVESLQRIFLLQEAANFDNFKELKLDKSLIRFFTKSDAIFKFFEELQLENVSFESLRSADAYAEFEHHIDILEQLFEKYQEILAQRGLSDRSTIPLNYELNFGFIQSFEKIELFIEGYLSNFELQLIERIAAITPITIHYATSRFNLKMQEKFALYGINLPKNSYTSFEFQTKRILSSFALETPHEPLVLQVEQRFEQIGVAFEQIERLVRSGIEPQNIVLLLPDESFKESFALYDHHRNLNFAMGFDYSKTKEYKLLKTLYEYWQKFESEKLKLLERYGFETKRLHRIETNKKTTIADFFTLLESLSLLDCKLEPASQDVGNVAVFEKAHYFLKIFEKQILLPKEWLFLWLKALGKITIDDIGGGKITVMGLLETRGVSFEGVVIVDFNEGIIPKMTAKDQFLNSSVRQFAPLPTVSDREALQKQLYKRVIEQAKESVIIYTANDEKLPSKFLYELGFHTAKRVQSNLNLLYNEPSQIIEFLDPKVENFDATSIVWSASKLKTFLKCKRAFYYQYIQYINPPKEEELNEGELLHTLLDKVFETKGSYANLLELEKSIDRELEILLPPNSAKNSYLQMFYREKLKPHLSQEVEHFQKGWRVVAKEYDARGKIAGLEFRGRIDRIDQTENQTLVIDYKSGSIEEANKSKNLESLIDFQMSIYYYLLDSKFQNISLGFWRFFEKEGIEMVALLEEKNRLLLERIHDLKETKSFTAIKCEELHKCTYCSYILLCERGEYL